MTFPRQKKKEIYTYLSKSKPSKSFQSPSRSLKKKRNKTENLPLQSQIYQRSKSSNEIDQLSACKQKLIGRNGQDILSTSISEITSSLALI
ncbi:unnamed protein product [Rhizophagus irregularis]|nr:unnamed protein product [Rhizophagus irregularis]